MLLIGKVCAGICNLSLLFMTVSQTHRSLYSLSQKLIKWHFSSFAFIKFFDNHGASQGVMLEVADHIFDTLAEHIVSRITCKITYIWVFNKNEDVID